MEIRKLETVSEILGSVPLAEVAFAGLGLPGQFCSEAFIYFCVSIVHSGDGTVIGVYKEDHLVGFICAVIFTEPFRGDRTCQEIFWYVLPEHRGIGGALLKRLERWARSKGAKRIIMPYRPGAMPESMQQNYLSRGYSVAETNYVKEW